MASDDEWEDGEILEEGEEVEDPALAPLPVKSVVSAAVIITSASTSSNSATATATAAAPLPPLPLQPPLPPLPPSDGVLGAAPPPLPPVSSAHYDVNPRKRLHSTMQNQHAPPPSSARYPAATAHHTNGSVGGRTPYPPAPAQVPHYSSAHAPLPHTAPPRREVETYSPELIVKFPRQVPTSNVLLDFGHWMAHARALRPHRLNVEDVQRLIVNVALGTAAASSNSSATGSSDSDASETSETQRVSPFFLDPLCPNKPAPTRVCVVLLANVHPPALQRYRPTLPFFNACTSVPVVLSKRDDTRRIETPLPELLYKFPRPPVQTAGLSAEELFYGHELTFMLRHSFGYTDELIVLPSGTFARKSQPLGGTWMLDGDLLHLQWRQSVQPTSSAAATNTTDDVDALASVDDVDSDAADAFTLDVLVSEDATMHYFNTDPLVDATYKRTAPEHLGVNRKRDDSAAASAPRTIRIGLVKAIAADVARHPDGSVVVPLRRRRSRKAVEEKTTSDEQATDDATASTEEAATAIEVDDDASANKSVASASAASTVETDNVQSFGIDYYVLTPQELVQHGFPVAVEDEQALLDAATNNCTRDRFVETQPRVQAPVATGDDSDTVMAAGDDENEPALFALDCEMCETDLGMELTRVTVVDQTCAVVYDALVKPQSTILNYLTTFSGITREMLAPVTTTVADVQRVLCSEFLFADTILIGHSLTSDLRALRIVHRRVADSAILYPHTRGFPFRSSLKYLTKTYLRQDIQLASQEGHDSAEDAIAAMALVQLKVKNGPMFGLPATDQPIGAFDSFVHKVSSQNKRMTLLRLDATGATDDLNKPWQRYASGDLTARARSPYVHAQAFAAGQTAASVAAVTDWQALSQRVAASFAYVEANAKEPDAICWVEIDGPSTPTVTNNFLFRHDAWMATQRTHCEAVDAFLQDLQTNVLPSGTLLLALPQSDVTMLRYLKGVRTRAKWRDAAMTWTDDMQAAVTDAYRGTIDSVLFATQQ